MLEHLGEDDEAVIMCARPEHTVGGPSPSSTITSCTDCGNDVYISAGSIALKERLLGRGVKVVHIRCCCCANAHSAEEFEALAKDDPEMKLHMKHTFPATADPADRCTVCGMVRGQFESDLAHLHPILAALIMSDLTLPSD